MSLASVCLLAGCSAYPELARLRLDNSEVVEGRITGSEGESVVVRSGYDSRQLSRSQIVSAEPLTKWEWRLSEGRALAEGGHKTEGLKYLRLSLKAPQAHVVRQAAEQIARFSEPAPGEPQLASTATPSESPRPVASVSLRGDPEQAAAREGRRQQRQRQQRSERRRARQLEGELGGDAGPLPERTWDVAPGAKLATQVTTKTRPTTTATTQAASRARATRPAGPGAPVPELKLVAWGSSQAQVVAALGAPDSNRADATSLWYGKTRGFLLRFGDQGLREMLLYLNGPPGGNTVYQGKVWRVDNRTASHDLLQTVGFAPAEGTSHVFTQRGYQVSYARQPNGDHEDKIGSVTISPAP